VHGGAHIIGRFKLSLTDAPNLNVIALPVEVETCTRTTSRTAKRQNNRLCWRLLFWNIMLIKSWKKLPTKSPGVRGRFCRSQ